MHYILYVQLDDFYLFGLKSEVSRSAKPVIVLREKHVIGRNWPAEERGVQIGMSEDHARALASMAEFRPWKAEDYVQLQENWLDICARYSGVIEPEDQHSAFIDLSLHPSPASVAVQLTEELASEGLPPKAGMASSKWVAKLAAGETRFEIADAGEFLADIPIDNLVPIDPEHRQRLKFFGYKAIGEVAGIQLATLKRQFGEDALRIRLSARGRLHDPVRPLYPKDYLIESLLFENPIESLETLDEALVSLAKRLGKRLREKDLFGAELHVEIESESQNKIHQRRFAKPIKCPLSLLSGLRLLLQDKLTEPVTAIRIRLPKLERTRAGQTDLLGLSEKEKSIASTLQNLRVAFGDSAVRSANEVQLPRRIRVLKEWKDALGWQ